MTTTAGSSDPKGINMTVQSENERNKAVVDEYFKAGVQGHLTSFAAYLHPDFTIEKLGIKLTVDGGMNA